MSGLANSLLRLPSPSTTIAQGVISMPLLKPSRELFLSNLRLSLPLLMLLLLLTRLIPELPTDCVQRVLVRMSSLLLFPTWASLYFMGI